MDANSHPSSEGNANGLSNQGGLFSPADERYCVIWVKGHLEDHWSDWLGGLSIKHEEGGFSLLSGFIPDQAALHGILDQIRDLGLTLISLNQTNVGGNR